MKRIRYLTTLLVLLLAGSTGLWAQDDTFNPANPPEPGQPPMKLEVTVTPGDAGSVSGTGRYAEGTQVSLYAYVNTGFRFINWTNAEGEEFVSVIAGSTALKPLDAIGDTLTLYQLTCEPLDAISRITVDEADLPDYEHY